MSKKKHAGGSAASRADPTVGEKRKEKKKTLPKRKREISSSSGRKDRISTTAPSARLVHGSGLAASPDWNTNAAEVTFRTVIFIITTVIMVRDVEALPTRVSLLFLTKGKKSRGFCAELGRKSAFGFVSYSC